MPCLGSCYKLCWPPQPPPPPQLPLSKAVTYMCAPGERHAVTCHLSPVTYMCAPGERHAGGPSQPCTDMPAAPPCRTHAWHGQLAAAGAVADKGRKAQRGWPRRATPVTAKARQAQRPPQHEEHRLLQPGVGEVAGTCNMQAHTRLVYGGLCSRVYLCGGYVCTCVPVYLCTCVPVWGLRVYLCTCVPVYLCTCVPVYLCGGLCSRAYLCGGGV